MHPNCNLFYYREIVALDFFLASVCFGGVVFLFFFIIGIHVIALFFRRRGRLGQVF